MYDTTRLILLASRNLCRSDVIVLNNWIFGSLCCLRDFHVFCWDEIGFVLKICLVSE